MTLKRVGVDISAAEWWNTRSKKYDEDKDTAYHSDRWKVIRFVLPPLKNKRVLDFGCGEGEMLRHAVRSGASVVFGIEPNAHFASIAERTPDAKVQTGGTEQLAHFPTASIEVFTALNVLGYLTEPEEATFYHEMNRIVAPGGHAIIAHSDALFDLFTLNAYTIDFFRREFHVDPSPLLKRPTEPGRVSFRVRENPLAYSYKLERFGFREQKQSFMNFHRQPPLISGDDPDDMNRARLDTLEFPVESRWKLMFQCSMFVSHSVKVAEP